MAGSNPYFRPLLLPTIATMIALAILVGLGVWQIERLHWKLGLIATINARMAAPADAAPLPAVWGSLDPKALEYHHLRLTGTFRHDKELFYFGQGDEGVAGYDVITPLVLKDGGGIVLVDRGFIPEEMKDPALRKAGEVEGEVTVVGVARAPQARDAFTVADDTQRNIWFTRDPRTMGAAVGLGPVAPFYVEADATPNPGGWPKGGRTRVDIRNEHFQYALTWFGLALGLVAVYLFYHRSQGRIGRPEE